MKTNSAKDRILKAAITLFAAQGYEVTTTREIVKLAGSSLSMLVRYFESKEGLYRAVLEKVVQVYVVDHRDLFAELVDSRDLQKYSRDTIWQLIEKMTDTLLEIISDPENAELITILNRELQRKESLRLEIEPAFMYLYNYQLLFEDYVGEDHGQWWARVLSFQTVTGIFDLLTYPNVLSPFHEYHTFLLNEDATLNEQVRYLKNNILVTIKATLDLHSHPEKDK